MDPREAARQFVADVKPALGDRLTSAILHGSVVRNEYVEGVSDVNVMLLMDEVSASSLGQLSPVVRRHVAKRVHPIIIEAREWRRASDVFGIELSEMQDWHELLAGTDPLMGLLVSPGNLRLQAERELRGKLLQLHLGMVVAESPERLGELLKAALPSLVTFLRTALRLARHDISPEAARTINDGCALAGAAPQGLLRVLEVRRRGGPLAVTLQDPLIDQVNTAAEALAEYIDSAGGEP